MSWLVLNDEPQVLNPRAGTRTLAFTTGLTVRLEGAIASDTIAALADDAAIATWADSSGNANDVVQGTGANRPLKKTVTYRGKTFAVARFDGTNDSLRAAAFAVPLGQPNTIFVVAKSDVATDTVNRPLVDGTATRENIYLRATGDRWAYNAESAEVNTSFLADTNWNIHEIIFDGANSIYVLSGAIIDAAGGTSPGAADLDQLTVGASADLSELWDGDIAAVFVYTGAVSSGNRATVRTYLQAVYGVSVFSAGALQFSAASNSQFLAVV